MAVSLKELQAPLPSPGSLLVSCGVFEGIVSRIERLVGERRLPADAAYIQDWRINPTSSWENNLAQAVSRQITGAYQPRGIFVRLVDPTGRGAQLKAMRGLDGMRPDDGVFDEPMPFEFEAIRRAQPVRLESLAAVGAHLKTARAFPDAQSAVTVPLPAGSSQVVGCLTLVFDGSRPILPDLEMDLLERTARHLSRVVSVHRTIERLLGQMRSSRAHVSAPSPALSAAIFRGGGGRETCTFPAAVQNARGETRLFAARKGVLGIGGAWEDLALDLAFRACSIACATPGDVIDLVGQTLSCPESNVGCAFRLCCADFTESGRTYRYSGSATHLLYDHRRQMVEEPPNPSGSGGDPAAPRMRSTRIHSGDTVLFHTCSLTEQLSDRHAMRRKLAGLLARTGRQPVSVIGAKVAETMREWCLCKHRNPALLILRSE